MSKKYRVLFHGPRTDRENFKSRMGRLGTAPDVVNKMIERAPVILKGELKLGAARAYAEAIQDAGGRVTIQEHGFFDDRERINPKMPIAHFEDFTMCPECGLRQPKADICAKCGGRLKGEKRGEEPENVGGH